MDDKIYEQMYTVAKIFMRKRKGFDIVQKIIASSGLLSKQTSKLRGEKDFDNNSQSSVYHMKHEIDSHQSSFYYSDNADDINFAFGEMAKKSWSSNINLNTYDVHIDYD